MQIHEFSQISIQQWHEEQLRLAKLTVTAEKTNVVL